MSNRVKPGRVRKITRRKYLEAKLIRDHGASIDKAKAAVSVMAEEHPEIDMDEEKSRREWEVLNG